MILCLDSTSEVKDSATVEKISGPGLVQAWPRELESIGKVWVKIAFKLPSGKLT